MESNKINIEHLSLSKSDDSEWDIFNELGNSEKLQNFKIKELIIDSPFKLDLNNFKLLYFIRPSLTKLKISKLSTEKWIDQDI
jgi:hypothetical protein